MNNETAVKAFVKARKSYIKAIKTFEKKSGISCCEGSGNTLHIGSVPDLFPNDKEVIVEKRDNDSVYPFLITRMFDGIKFFSLHESPTVRDTKSYKPDEFLSK